MAGACPVTTKWKVVGNVDVAPWVWVVVAVVVVALIVLLLLSGGRRRKAMQAKRDQEHREKAAEIRREAENMELDAREREAKAVRARADAEQAQVDAARLRQEAEQRSQEAQSLRNDVAGHARKADEVDPDVGRDGTRRGVREAYEDRQAQAQADGRDGHGHTPHHETGRGEAPIESGRRDAADAADTGHAAPDDPNRRTGI
jgi:heme exporter protein D